MIVKNKKPKVLRQSVIWIMVIVWVFTKVTWNPLINDVAAARASVDITSSTTASEHNGSSPMMVVVSNTNAYTFYVDSGGQCVYSKTTTLNSATPTWAAAVQIDSQTDCTHLAVWYDRWTPGDTTGNYIHIVTSDVGNDDLWYNRLDVSTDTRLLTASPVTISSSTAPAKTNTFVTTANMITITKATDGVLYAGVIDDSATGSSWVHKCSTTCNTASNWSDKSPDFETGTYTIAEGDSMILMPQPDGDIMMIDQNDTTDDVLAKIYDVSADTWGNFVVVDSSAVNNTTYDGNTIGATIDKSTYEIYLIYGADIGTIGTDDDIRTALYDPVTATWTAKTDVLTNNAMTAAKLTIDEGSGTVYATYVRRTTGTTATTGNVYFKSSTDKMVSWSAESSSLVTTADDLYGMTVPLMSNEHVYVTWYDLAADDINGNTVADLTPITSSVEQAVYRLYANANSADVGATRAAVNTGYTLTSRGEAIRVRMLLKVTTANLSSSGQNFKLQVAYKGSGSCTAPQTVYQDVSSTTPLSYLNNASPTDGGVLTANANDPTNGGDTIVNQTYEEANNFTNSQGAVNTSQDGKWDFALVDNNALASGVYCLRAVKAGGESLTTYTQFPQITISSDPTYEQSNYRIYTNADSTDVGSAYAAQNTAYTLTSFKQTFRVRMLVAFSSAGALTNGASFKLQYAAKGAGSCSAPSGTPSTYTDVTTSTAVAYNDNATPTDNTAVTSNANDPTSSNTIRKQTYEEGNNFTNSQLDVAAGEDAMWDFSLKDLDMASGETYCLRAVQSLGTAFTTYTQYPQITAESGAIDRTPDTVTTDYQNTGSNIVFVSDQVGYVFYLDSDLTAVYKKTTDGGATWGSAVVVDSQLDGVTVQVWYDQWTPGDTGTTIHILTADTGNDDLWYTSLDTSSDTLSTTVSAVSNSAQGGSITTASSLPSITKGTNGTLYMGIIDNGDSYVVTCTATCSTATNWTELGTSPFGVPSDSLILMPLAGGDLMAIDWQKTSNVIQSYVYSGGAWSGATSIDATATENTTYDSGIAATINISNNDIYLTTVQDTATLGGSNDDVQAFTYSGGAWTANTNVITNDTRGITDTRIFRDENTGDLYAIYAIQNTAGTASTGEIYYKKSTDGMTTWGTEQGPISLATGDIWSPQVNTSSNERLYLTYYDNTTTTFNGATVVDLVAATPTPTPTTGPTNTPTATPTPGSYQTPTYVQGATNPSASSNSTQTATFASSVTSGNLVVVAVSHWNATVNSDVTSVTDNKGNTYTKAVSDATSQSGANEPIVMYYAYNVSGGSSFTVTANNATSAYMTVSVLEYSGFGTSDPLDKTAHSNGTGTAGNSGNTATTTQSDELIVGAFNHESASTTATAGTNFTMREYNDDNNTTETIYTEDRNVTSTGAYNSTITFAGSVTWRAVVATFKPDIAAGPTNTPTPTLTPTPTTAPPAYPYHRILYEQSTYSASATTPSILSFSNPVKNGNMILVAISETQLGAAVISSVTDNKGNSYAKAVSAPATEFGSVRPVVLYYAYNVTGGSSFQVTVTNTSGTATQAVAILEYSGATTASDPLDKTAVGQGSSTTPSSGSTATTTQDYELVFGLLGHQGAATTATAGTNFTMRAYGDADFFYTEDRFVTTTGTYAATGTYAVAKNWDAAVATFKSAPGPTNDQIMRHGKYWDSLLKKVWPFGF